MHCNEEIAFQWLAVTKNQVSKYAEQQICTFNIVDNMNTQKKRLEYIICTRSRFSTDFANVNNKL